MNFEGDFERLEKTVRALRWGSGLVAAAAVALLFAALVFAPGRYGGVIRFHTIMIHLDLQGYIADAGVQTRLLENSLVLGVPRAQIMSAFRILQFLLGITVAGSLLRLQWRWALGAGAALFILITIGRTTETKDGYQVAEIQEFGVVQPETKPHLGVINASFNPGPNGAASYAAFRAELDVKNAERTARAARMRADFANPPPSMTPAQKAAMQFMGAQIGYLEENLPVTVHYLNAISARDFNPTWDADYRLRIIREWVEKNGGVISPGAYAPTTGLSFGVQRIISTALAWVGWPLLLVVFVMVELSRRLARKVRRLRGLAARLTESNPVFEAGDQKFGRRPASGQAKFGLATG